MKTWVRRAIFFIIAGNSENFSEITTIRFGFRFFFFLHGATVITFLNPCLSSSLLQIGDTFYESLKAMTCILFVLAGIKQTSVFYTATFFQ